MSEIRSTAARTVHAEVERGSVLGSWRVAFRSEAVPGTLAVFAGVLSLARLDISSALVSKRADGTVHDAFDVHPLEGAALCPADAEGLARAAADAMAGKLNLGLELRDLRRRFPATSSAAPVVEIVTDSEFTTGVKVRAADRPGLLYDIASALTRHGMRTRSLTVLTFGGQANDTFRVVDSAGAAPTSAPALERLRADLLSCCG